MRALACFRDKLEKLPIKPWGSWAFFSFSPIFHLSLPKIWLILPTKIMFLELATIALSFAKFSSFSSMIVNFGSI